MKDADDQLVPLVTDISEARALVRPDTGAFSVGGMSTKLTAVETAATAGVDTIIANGRKPSQIAQLVAGDGICTRFQF